MASYAGVAVPLQGAATPVTTPTPGHTCPDAAAGVSDFASPVPRTRITRPRYVRRRRRTASNLRPADALRLTCSSLHSLSLPRKHRKAGGAVAGSYGFAWARLVSRP